MKCPKCSCQLVGWRWQDGCGYKGVECSGCSQTWWSDIFADAAMEAEKQAVKSLLETFEFPTDAETEQDRRKRYAKPGEF
jgi:hypothetical protein